MRHRSVLFAFLFLVSPLHGSLDAGTLAEPFYYLSPLPGAQQVSSQTTLIFRATDTFKVSQGDWTQLVSVRGDISGPHDGRWVHSPDGRTVIFEPAQPFNYGETVRVTVGPGSTPYLAWAFSVRNGPVQMQPAHRLCDCVAPFTQAPTLAPPPERAHPPRPRACHRTISPTSRSTPTTTRRRVMFSWRTSPFRTPLCPGPSSS